MLASDMSVDREEEGPLQQTKEPRAKGSQHAHTSQDERQVGANNPTVSRLRQVSQHDRTAGHQSSNKATTRGIVATHEDDKAQHEQHRRQHLQHCAQRD